MKIHEYREMMRHLTRKPVSRDLMQAASVEEPVAMAEGGMVERVHAGDGYPTEVTLGPNKGKWHIRYSDQGEIKTFWGTKKEAEAVQKQYEFKPAYKLSEAQAKKIIDKLPTGVSLAYNKSKKAWQVEGRLNKDKETLYRNVKTNPTPEEIENIVEEFNAAKKKLLPNILYPGKFQELRLSDKYIDLGDEAFAKVLNDKGYISQKYKPFYRNTVYKLQKALGINEDVGSVLYRREMPEVRKIILDHGGEVYLKEFKGNESYLRKLASKMLSRDKQAKLSGQFPWGPTKEHRMWKNFYESSQRSDRIIMEGTFNGKDLADPENWPRDKKGKISWFMKDVDGTPAYKKVTFTDTQAPGKPKTFSFTEAGTLKSQINDTFGEGFFEKNTKAYDAQKLERTKTITVDGKEVNLNKYLAEQMIRKEYDLINPGKEPSQKYIERRMKNYNFQEVHHPFGSGQDPYTVELASRTANRKLGNLEAQYQLGNLTREEYAKNIKQVSDEFGGIRYNLEGKFYGKKGNLESIIQSLVKNNNLDPKVAEQITKNPEIKQIIRNAPKNRAGQILSLLGVAPAAIASVYGALTSTPAESAEPDSGGNEFETYTDFDEGKDETQTSLNPLEEIAAVGSGMAIGEGAHNIARKVMEGEAVKPQAIKELKAFVPKAAVRGLQAFWTPLTALVGFDDLKALLSSPEERQAHFSRYIDPEQGKEARGWKELGLGLSPSMVRTAGQLAGTYGSTVANPKGLDRLMTRGFLERVLNLGMSVPTALRVARIASPIGWAALAGEQAYDFYKQNKEINRLLKQVDEEVSDPEEKQKIKDYIQGVYRPVEGQREEIESMGYQGAKDGGRIGFQDGSDGEESIPLLDESNIKKEESGLRGLYYNINAAGPSTVGYADDKFNVSASKNLRPGPMEDKGMTYKLDIRPNDDGTFSIVKTPYTKSIGYTKGDEDFNYGISAIQTPMGPQFQAGLNLKFASGGRVGFADGPEDPNKLLPMDPLLQDNALQDPGRRNVLKVGAAGAGIMALSKLGLLKLGKTTPAVEAVTTTMGPETPEIIKSLYTTILKQGKKTVENKIIKPSVPEGEPVTTYNYHNYEVVENSEGVTIFREIDNGDFGYRQEVFQLRKDPETGKMVFEDITVRPDYDGKLKDIEYGVEPESYGEIGNFLANVNKNDKFIRIAEKDIKKMLPEE